jgi:MFS transporter, ACS family, D-galactonate transporter
MKTAASPRITSMSWTSWRIVLLLMATCFLAHFNRIGMQVAGDNWIMGEYGITPTAMGVVYSSFIVTYTLLMIPGGWLIDRSGPKFCLLAVGFGSALFVVSTGLVGLAIASSTAAYIAFLVIRGSMGLVSAPLHPAAARAVSLGIPFYQRSAANGLITGAALFGIASTYVLFFLMIKWLGWPIAFISSGLATAIVAVLWNKYATSDLERVPTIATSPVALGAEPDAPMSGGILDYLRRNKNLLLLASSYAAVGYFQYLFFYWIPHYFAKVLQLEEMAAQLSSAIPSVAMAIGMSLGGVISDRVLVMFGWRAARAGLAMVSMLASAGLLLVGIYATENPFWIVTWLSLALGVLGLVEGSFWVTAVEVGGARGGLSAGIFNTGGNLGGLLAPIVTPWVSTTLGYGWPAAIAIGSIVCVAGAVAWIWIDDPSGQASKASPSPSISPTSLSLASATSNI